MDAFVYEGLPGRVIFGAGAARRELAGEVLRLGVERPLVVAAPPEHGLAEDLTGTLTVAGLFADVRPHVPVAIADAATAAARAVGADALLSIGGGSTTGTAKAVALRLGLPIIAVPTTYAGSEVTQVWGMTEGGRKTTGVDRRVLPHVVVYDPELTVTLPPAVTAASAMNALAHCVEALYAAGASPLSTLAALEGIRALVAGAPGAVAAPADVETRGLTLYGAYLAGTAFATAGSALHHKICHVLGGAYDLPHAETHTAVLPQVVSVVERRLPEVAVRLADAFGASPAAAIHDLATSMGCGVALSEHGLAERDVPGAADLITGSVSAAPPGPLDRAEIEALLTAAVRGTRPTEETL